MEARKYNSISKNIRTVLSNINRHWVGDGFHVYGLVRPRPDIVSYISPFILMDYAAPEYFDSTTSKRGVGEHPHRGFETVTLAYQGEVEHRDSSGGGGIIRSGDIQWMTAGSGLVHEEFHSTNFSSEGGVFEMVQLWVNLPQKDKMTTPKYQGIGKGDIPIIELDNEIVLRVIAGEFQSIRGPASTYTSINMYDIESTKGGDLCIDITPQTNTLLLVRNGEVLVDGQVISSNSVVVFEREGDALNLTVSSEFKGLILNGDPINEPVVAHGPFVMNTEEEIIEAIDDYQSGKMGHLS